MYGPNESVIGNKTLFCSIHNEKEKKTLYKYSLLNYASYRLFYYTDRKGLTSRFCWGGEGYKFFNTVIKKWMKPHY